MPAKPPKWYHTKFAPFFHPAEMHLEIHIALSYLATHLYNKLPRRRINLFTELLSSSLSNKYQGHWYPQQPQRGSAFRCLKSTDPLIKTATIEANIAYTDVIESLPKDLCLWVDPGEVSYSVGEGGATRVLWKEGDEVDFGYGGGAWSALSPVEDSAAAAAAAWMWGGAGGAQMVDGEYEFQFVDNVVALVALGS